MKESDLISKHIRPYLDSIGARTIKYHGGAFSEAGVADLLICYQGNFIALEVKVGKEEPRLNQLAFLRSIEKAGGKAGWCNEKNWKEIIDKLILCGLD